MKNFLFPFSFFLLSMIFFGCSKDLDVENIQNGTANNVIETRDDNTIIPTFKRPDQTRVQQVATMVNFQLLMV